MDSAHGMCVRVFFFSLTERVSAQQCIQEITDYQSCDFNCKDSQRSLFCYCAEAKKQPLANLLHPGFFVRQANGRLVVSAIVPASPADRLGLQPGDEILSINGRSPHLQNLCHDQPWEAQAGKSMAVLEISRANGPPSTLSVPLAPIGSLLDQLWTSESPARMESKVALGVHAPKHNYQTYSFGLEFAHIGKDIAVVDVLLGSPADMAGIRPGDVLTEVDDHVIKAPEQSTFLQLDSYVSSGTLRLQFAGRGHTRQANLPLLSLIDILASAPATRTRQQLTLSREPRNEVKQCNQGSK